MSSTLPGRPAPAPRTTARRSPGAARHLPGAVRMAGALTAAVLLSGAVAPAASAAASSSPSAAPSASAAPKLPAGLYGKSDPTYDGVFRQSTALLALSAAGVTPPAPAVTWLLGQQCADGGFGAYRADTAKPCAARSEDTNSTGMAVQALSSFGSDHAAVVKAVAWLKKARNADGGWGYQLGAGTDPDSTALVVGALRASGGDAGSGPVAALLKLEIGCGSKAAALGAFAYQPGKGGALSANAKATTDAIIALRDSGYLVRKPAADLPAISLVCASRSAKLSPQAAASGAAAYLQAAMKRTGGQLVALEPGASKPAPDPGTTAYAVIAFAADGQLAEARSAYQVLESHEGLVWADSSPAALGALILAAHAAGENPHEFGGSDLVTQLVATGPAVAKASGGGGATTTATATSTAPAKKSSSPAVWWIVGVCVLAGIGVGIALSLRKKKQA